MDVLNSCQLLDAGSSDDHGESSRCQQPDSSWPRAAGNSHRRCTGAIEFQGFNLSCRYFYPGKYDWLYLASAVGSRGPGFSLSFWCSSTLLSCFDCSSKYMDWSSFPNADNYCTTQDRLGFRVKSPLSIIKLKISWGTVSFSSRRRLSQCWPWSALGCSISLGAGLEWPGCYCSPLCRAGCDAPPACSWSGIHLSSLTSGLGCQKSDYQCIFVQNLPNYYR